jgi:uncharacterized membrane protein YraQ (UPF0718 family)
MNEFLSNWGSAAYTTLGFFWMALWAFILGYAISSMIQIFVTHEKMKSTMGESNAKSVFLGTFFGFISSSCSFSALASAKSLFKKGASFISSLAFLLSSTNLVIELGIVISIFLGWQFVVGEYIGGVLLILISWLLVSIIKPKKLIENARKKVQSEGMESDSESRGVLEKLKSEKAWAKVGKQYIMEWKMVWKDVTIGFTIAGIISVFVPDAFFQNLFINTGGGQETFSFLTLLEHTLVGPIAAFLTFIGSMGNIPLAALLFGKGVSFAGVMAFIFSDLVVFPVLRINARYYGWKMALFILLLLFVSLIITSLSLHYGLNLLNMLPDASDANILKADHFELDYTFYFNLAFLLISGVLVYLAQVKGKGVKHQREMAMKSPLFERILKWIALLSYIWLLAGILIYFLQ